MNSDKKPNKNRIKLFLKPSLDSSKKILSNIRYNEKQNKENKLECSSSNINTNKLIHESNLKEIENLENELNILEKQNELLVNEINLYKKQQKALLEKYNQIKNEYETESEKLDELKEINEDKNRKYLELMHLRNQRQVNNNNDNEINNSNNNTERNDNNYTNNNNHNDNEIDRMADLMNGFNFLLNISRFRRAYEEQEDREDREESSINTESNNFENYNNDEGPPMTQDQLQGLPTSIYPRNNNNNEKCEICKFEFCYNDTIIKLACNHVFHKDCLINRLTARNSSKCPTCKVSII